MSANGKAFPRPRFVIEEVEPRILYSADLSPLDVHASPLPVVEQRIVDTTGEFVGLASPEASHAPIEQTRHEIAFVDAATPDAQALINDINEQSGQERQIDVVLLDTHSDGIGQITSYLRQAKDISAIHILSHGADGTIQLGNTQLNFDSLLENATKIKSWAQSLTLDSNLLIYGCDVAQTSNGQSLVNALSRLTGVNAAASVDPTGARLDGGDWDLEYQTGPIRTPVIVSTGEQYSWDHLLEEPAGAITPPVAATQVSAAPATAAAAEVTATSVPMVFEPNVGQAGTDFDFIAHGSGYAVGLTKGNATIAADNGDSSAVVHLDVVGKNADVHVEAEDLLGSKANYLIGDADQYHQDVANYGAVRYSNVYDGIDLRYYGTQRQLEYDFIVNPGAAVDAIRLHFDGVRSQTIAENGDLVLTLDSAGHSISFKAPVAYQDGPSGREAVDSHYVIAADGTIGFETAAYDTSRALVIDPVLSYASYFGDSTAEAANAVAVDAAGNVYMTGYATPSGGLLGGLLNGVLGLGTGGAKEVMITKMAPDLRSVIYSTYIGGGGDDVGTAIAIDASGNAYVTGYTKSNDLPTASAYDSTRGGSQDAFVLKLNAAGNALVYSTYLGGSGGSDVGYGIAIDSAGSAYVTGFASSADFPTTIGAAHSSYAGGDAFVAKLGIAGNTLVYSTFIGGSASDSGYGIALDASGNAVIVGETSSSNFSVTAAGYQQTYGGGTDAFVTKLNSTGTAFTYSSYLGGSGKDIAHAVALGSTGNIYLTGETNSNNFDVTAGAYETNNPGKADGFLSIVDPGASGASSLVYSTYLGGNGAKESGTGIGVDSAGQVYVAAYSDSDPAGHGGVDGWVIQISPNGAGSADLRYQNFLGGAKLDELNAGVYANGKFYVVGDTGSNSGIATAGSYDTTFGGGTDAFAAVYTFNIPPVLTGTSGPLAYNEGGGKVAVDGAITISDDGALLAGASVQIAANYVNGEDLLDFNNANPWGISAVWVAATGTLTLTGDATVANYQAALRSVTYQNISDKPSTSTRSVAFIATDGVFASIAINRSISVASINDAPVNAIPGAQTVSEDTALVFSALSGNAISIADTDAGSAAVQITLSVSNGKATLAQTTGLTFITGNGTANQAMTFTGTVSAINTALNGLRFEPTANFNGAANLQIVTNDLGNSGSGGPLTVTSNIAIAVNPVNDAPLSNVPGPQGTAQNTALVFSSANGNAITVSDIDAGTGSLQITLTAANGVLSLGSLAGLTSVAGDGTAAVVISGALTDLNNALDGLSFLPDFNYGGAASIQVVVDDQGNSGTGSALTNTNLITVTVSGNVAPAVVASAAPLSYTENAPAIAIDPALNVTDPDSPLVDHAVVRVAANYTAGEDFLGFTDQLGIAGSWDAATGTLTLTGAANAADYQTALRSVTYQNTSDNPTTTNRSISFVVNDGVADGAAAARAVTLTAVNDAPIASAPPAQSANEDTALVFSAGSGNGIFIADPDAGQGSISVTLSAANGTVTLAQMNGLTTVAGNNASSNVTVTGTIADINAALNGLSFQASANFYGAASLNVSVDDQGNTGAGGAMTSTAAVAINVVSVNDAPSAADNTIVILEDTAYTFTVADFGFNDASDSPADGLAAVFVTTLPSTGSLTDNGVTLTAGQSVSVANIAAGKLVFTPTKDGNGAGYASFTFQVQDDGGTANGGLDVDPTPHTMTIDVTAVNDAPVGADSSVSAVENTTYTFTASDFAFTDPNDAPSNALLSVIVTTLPAAGILTLSGVAVTAGQAVSAASVSGGTLQFTPAANANGAAYSTFTFELQDDGGTGNGGIDAETAPHTMTIDVAAINSAPQGSSNTVTAAEDTPYVFAAADFGFSDANDLPANNLLAIKVTSVPGAGSLTDNGVAVISGQFVSLTDINSGKLVFQAAVDANGLAYSSFTFKVQDDGGTANGGADLDVAARTMTIDVMPVNDAPTGTANTVVAIEDTAYTFTTADFGFSDAADSPAKALKAVKISALPTAGCLTDNGAIVATGQFVSVADIGSGKLQFIAAPNANGAAYTAFTFQVQDNGATANGGADVDATPRGMTIDVTPLNDAPIVTVNTGASGISGAAIVIGPADLQAADPDNTPAQLVYTLTALPASGNLQLSGAPLALNGTFTQADVNAGLLTYLQGGAAVAGDDFVLSISDGVGGTAAPLTFSIAVASPMAVSPSPVSAPAPSTTTGGNIPIVATPAPAPARVALPALQPADPVLATPATTSAPSEPSATADASTAGDTQGTVRETTSLSIVYSGSMNDTETARATRAHFQQGGALLKLDHDAIGAGSQSLTSVVESDAAFVPGGDLVSFDVYRTTLSNEHWVSEINRMRGDVAAQIGMEHNVVASALVVTGGLTVGYVVWLLRGGLLLSSLLSSLPAWQIVDPLPVLAQSKRKDKADDADGDAVENLFGRAGPAAEDGRVTKMVQRAKAMMARMPQSAPKTAIAMEAAR
jgi:hypothetical protein